MNFTYFRFLFFTTIKKKPVWVIWLIYLLTCVTLLIVAPGIAKMNPLQLWANTTMPILQSFIGLVVAIFTATLGVHIFKDGNEEGTELIVLSKPINRHAVILTKFILYGFMCILVNLSCIAITCFTIFLPNFETKYYWGLLVSMLIGNGVVFAIYGSIAILLTVKFAKAGVIVTNTMISLVFVIYQLLSLVAFTTPVKSLADHGVVKVSYITANRNDNGEYQEDHLVNFTFTKLQEMLEDDPTVKVLDDYTWDAVAKYWKEEILGKTSVPGLNATDLASQLALTYMSVDLNKYSDRQASRNFAISRFYNYELVSPASPEIINYSGEKKVIPFTYGLPNVYSVPHFIKDDYDICIPSEVFITAIPPTGASRLQGLQNKMPIGYTRESGKLLSNKTIYFEPEEWQKYKAGFEKIYNVVFEPDWYKNISELPTLPGYEKSLIWCYNQQNFAHFFDLVWSCLTGHTNEQQFFGEDVMGEYNKEYFGINSIEDLNERFIQLKYYIGYRVQQDQNKYLNQSAINSTEKTYKDAVYNGIDEFQVFAALTNTELYNDTWFAKQSNSILPLTIDLTGPNQITPYLNLMKDTAKAMENYDEDSTKTTYYQYLKTASIFTKFVDPLETYLYKDLSAPTRTAKIYGTIHSTALPYYTWFETELTAKNHNMGLFYFNSKPTVNYWMFAVIWMSISLGLFAAGIVVYNKYDVK